MNTVGLRESGAEAELVSLIMANFGAERIVGHPLRSEELPVATRLRVSIPPIFGPCAFSGVNGSTTSPRG